METPCLLYVNINFNLIEDTFIYYGKVYRSEI